MASRCALYFVAMAEELAHIRLFPEELRLLGAILKRAGYDVINPEDRMTIIDQLQELQTTLASEPVPPSAVDVATAVVAALPTPVDITAALAAIQTTIDTLTSAVAAGQTVDVGDLQAIQASVDQINATLGTPPTPPTP